MTQEPIGDVQQFAWTSRALHWLMAILVLAMMYALMFALPLVGWGMLSAARYPIVLFGPIHLPPILPVSVGLYSALRQLHSLLHAEPVFL